MDSIANMRAFLAVMRSGSFSRAANQLGLSPSVVSKRIRQLEAQLASPLLTRTTHEVAPTPFGEESLASIARIIASFDDLLADRDSRRRAVAGTIRIKLPTVLGIIWFSEVLCRFKLAHPKIDLHVVLADRSFNPLEERFDIAITAGSSPYGGVVDVPLHPYPRIIVAAPAYLERHGTPSKPADLTDHQTLVIIQEGPIWTLNTPQGPIRLKLQSNFMSNVGHVLLAAAVSGQGIALLTPRLCASAIARGDLVRILEDFPVLDRGITAQVPATRLALPRIQAMLQFMHHEFARNPL